MTGIEALTELSKGNKILGIGKIPEGQGIKLTPKQDQYFKEHINSPGNLRELLEIAPSFSYQKGQIHLDGKDMEPFMRYIEEGFPLSEKGNRMGSPMGEVFQKKLRKNYLLKIQQEDAPLEDNLLGF